MDIGFIGLGRMGSTIAANLVKAGHAVTVWNRSPAKADVLVEDRFTPAGFTAPLGLKDMTLADAAATASRVPMPLLGIVRDHLRSVIAMEGEAVDWAGTALAARRGAGL